MQGKGPILFLLTRSDSCSTTAVVDGCKDFRGLESNYSYHVSGSPGIDAIVAKQLGLVKREDISTRAVGWYWEDANIQG